MKCWQHRSGADAQMSTLENCFVVVVVVVVAIVVFVLVVIVAVVFVVDVEILL